MENSKPNAETDIVIPNQPLGIFLISLLILLLETLFIRWIGTEIRIFAYLQNTILVTCFLGLGLGAFTPAKPIKLQHSLIPLVMLLALMALPMVRDRLGYISELLSVTDDLLIWQYFAKPADFGLQVLSLFVGLVATYCILILVVDIFVPLGRMLGRLLNAQANPIQAYSINLLGSVLGSWLFVVLSFFYQPPWVWFLVVGGLLAPMLWWFTESRKLNLLLLITMLVLAWLAGQQPDTLSVIWSPYQKLVVRLSGANDMGMYVVNVNNVGYQDIMDLSEANVAAQPDKFPPEQQGFSQYDLPLLFHPNPQTFLVVGAGSGNDVAGALRQGVPSITAVEIDPVIIQLGRDLHPEQPYAAPNVTLINDDARSFFATTQEKYDVIAFGLLDSHTTTSMTNARLDHYVYTRESIAQAKSLLRDGGVMVLTFLPQRFYIIDRMYEVLSEVFGEPPITIPLPGNAYGRGGVMFIVGDLANVHRQLENNPRLKTFIERLQAADPIVTTQTTKIATDDWPYIYLETPTIPNLYYWLIGLMGLIFVRSYFKWQAAETQLRLNRTFWHFFFLGAAFLLLEVQNISKASVVLGNTWQVNAVIISSVLAMALCANWLAATFPRLPRTPVYVILIAVCLALYFVDLAQFGFLPYPLKAAIVGALTSLPMLFSGIVFVRSFASAADKSNALGANLIGALVGALLQSITFVVGIKALLLIVAGFYLLSLFIAPHRTE